MKKILTILAVALLACTTVFAAVNFSGSSTIGYMFNYGHVQDSWSQLFWGDDGDDTNPNTLNLSISDDNGIWSVGFRAGITANEKVGNVDAGSDAQGATLGDSGSMGGNVTIDFAKLIGLEDWTLNAGMIGNDRYTTLRAYSNQSGKNFDRIRTQGGSYVAWLGVGYGGLVEAQVAVDPGLNGNSDNTDNKGNTNFDDAIVTKSDLLVSTLITPLSGLEVSVDYALRGDSDAAAAKNVKDLKGVVSGAVDVNLGTMLDLGFNLGISATDRYNITTEGNDLAVTVYGGVDVVDVAVEYAYTTTADADAHFLYVGANLNVVENMLLDVYFGANNLAEFADTYYIGGDVGYTISGMTFKLGIEYSEGDSKEYDLDGFNIVPSVSFSW